MPIDTSIYAQQQPFRLNTPFETLGQIGQIQQQQSAIRAAQALEEERRQQIADAQRKQADADQFNAVIGNPNITRDALLEQIRVKAPQHYLGALKSFQDLDKSAAEYDKLKLEAKDSAARAQEGMNKVIATTANGIAAHNYAPAAFEAGLKELETKFPDFKSTADNYRQLALQGGPDWIKEHVDGLRTMADRSAAAELPKKEADSALAQQVFNNSYGGMTPEQRSQEDNRAAQREQEDTRIGLERQRVQIEQNKAKAAADVLAKGKPLTQAETDKISDLDKSISTIGALRGTLEKGNTGFLANMESKYVPDFMAGVVPGATAAKATQAEITLAQNVVARIIHGGVLRANDQVQASKYLPQLGDSRGVIQEKLDAIEKLANETRRDHVKNLGKSGYDVSGFQDAATSDTRVYYDSNGRPIQK